MNFLADENFPAVAVTALRGAGHDVRWIRESFPGIGDQQVLALGVQESRVLLTFDKDFGELAFKAKLPASSGIILFRFRKQNPEMIATRTLGVIASRTDWPNHFTVVEEARIRMTALAGDAGTIGRIAPSSE